MNRFSLNQFNAIGLLLFFQLLLGCNGITKPSASEQQSIGKVDQDQKWLGFEFNPKDAELAFYWQNEQGENYRSFERLKKVLNEADQELLFATNGGMFNPLFAPVGLYIERGEILSPIDTFSSRNGNFYLMPNGVFSISNTNVPSIQQSEDFRWNDSIYFATQSGPMLLIDGAFHPAFIKGSTNVNIRNGVGLLPNGNLYFLMSKEEVNFYDFANYFKQKGCENALYLDGYVSRTYLPQANFTNEDGDFGVIIGISRSN